MPEDVDDEVNAIKVVLKALEPLSPDARVSVVEYVSKRLGISIAGAVEPMRVAPVHALQESAAVTAAIHLKDFTTQKSPRSANEMAAIVAYYLAELAPAAQRKKSVNSEDMKTYFKIGEFPLPDLRFTLPNAKNAGYFDALGDGKYQLNAVGHNLVAHSLPRSSAIGASQTLGRKKTRKAAKHAK